MNVGLYVHFGILKGIQYGALEIDTKDLSNKHLLRAYELTREAVYNAIAVPIALAIIIPLGLLVGAGLLGMSLCIRDKREAVIFQKVGGVFLGGSLSLPVGVIIKVIRSCVGIFYPPAYFANTELPKEADRQLPALFNAIDTLFTGSEYEAVKHTSRLIFSWSLLSGIELPDSQLTLYQKEYRDQLLQIESIFSGVGEKELDDDEKRVIIMQMDDAFKVCIPSWGATLEEITLSINEPTAPNQKVGYFTNGLKRQIVNKMARQYRPNESRHHANGILELIGTRIHLEKQIKKHDINSFVPQSDEVLLDHFYSEFTYDKVHSHIKHILNHDNRSDLRTSLLSELACLGNIPDEDEEGNDVGTLTFLAFLEESFTKKGVKVSIFNDRAIDLLIREELNEMELPEGWFPLTIN